jgi:integrase
MAGHIQDRWYKTEKDANGKPHRVKTNRHGTGMRYRARYIGPDGTEKSQSFPDKQKRQAEDWLSRIEADMSRGQYVNPRAARITFGQYAKKWLDNQTTDPTSRSAAEKRLRLHALPRIGTRPLDSFQPSHIRDLMSSLDKAKVSTSYQRDIFSTVRAVLSASVDDGLLTRNPCSAQSVTVPKSEPRRIVPWTADRVFAVRAELPDEFRAMVDLGSGCGMRQGEIFGLAVDALDFDGDTLHIVRQVKLLRGKLFFGLPKGGKLREVPLPGSIADSLRQHMKEHPPADVTLPWLSPTGPAVTHRLLFVGSTSNALRANQFNDSFWKPALVGAGVLLPPKPGRRVQAARQHGMHALRHFYASVLLDAGESIRALSEYLGHADPGFTLRTYTHMMPSSRDRTRRAVDAIFGGGSVPDGPQTAQPS